MGLWIFDRFKHDLVITLVTKKEEESDIPSPCPSFILFSILPRLRLHTITDKYVKSI